LPPRIMIVPPEHREFLTIDPEEENIGTKTPSPISPSYSKGTNDTPSDADDVKMRDSPPPEERTPPANQHQLQKRRSQLVDTANHRLQRTRSTAGKSAAA